MDDFFPLQDDGKAFGETAVEDERKDDGDHEDERKESPSERFHDMPKVKAPDAVCRFGECPGDDFDADEESDRSRDESAEKRPAPKRGMRKEVREPREGRVPRICFHTEKLN